MALRATHALAILGRIGNRNAKGEFYLTDAVEVAAPLGGKAVVVVTRRRTRSWASTIAPSSPAQRRSCRTACAAAAMIGGSDAVAPETVFFSADTRIGRDVLIEPHVVFGPGVTVEDGATIHAFSHLEGARVASGASVGPFARLRPGAASARKAPRSATSSRSRTRRSATAPRSTTCPISATRRSGRTPTSARARSPAITTASSSTARDRGGRLRRLELLARRARDDRRGRLCRLGLGGDGGRAGRCARGRPRPPGAKEGWAEAFRDRLGAQIEGAGQRSRRADPRTSEPKLASEEGSRLPGARRLAPALAIAAALCLAGPAAAEEARELGLRRTEDGQQAVRLSPSGAAVLRLRLGRAPAHPVRRRRALEASAREPRRAAVQAACRPMPHDARIDPNAAPLRDFQLAQSAPVL